MPFIANGGLFISLDPASYQIGDQIFVRLKLTEQHEQLVFVAKVVWLVSGNSVSKQRKGIGVQIIDEEGANQTRLENLLIAHLDSGKANLTL